ncbi:MAG: DUF2760 domain-containing protein [Myxococcales bacterium]|nr:DUF2760 domain-containing protein [Myxococcales bacterium]
MNETAALSFFARLAMAFVCLMRILFDARFALAIAPAYRARRAPELPPAAKPQEEVPPEKAHASGLFLLSMLQREGRLIDFLQEEIAGYSDAEVGAAARVVHEGCRKVVGQYLAIEPVLPEAEGASVTVAAGFDAQRIRLTGNVAGQPPFKGSLKHHGWAAREVKLPPPPAAIDPKILAPAEVELP